VCCCAGGVRPSGVHWTQHPGGVARDPRVGRLEIMAAVIGQRSSVWGRSLYSQAEWWTGEKMVSKPTNTEYSMFIHQNRVLCFLETELC
jgi:hypothetical protein